MKSMWPPLAAIFFMTYFYRALGGPWPPRHPLLDPLLKEDKHELFTQRYVCMLCLVVEDSLKEFVFILRIGKKIVDLILNSCLQPRC